LAYNVYILNGLAISGEMLRKTLTPSEIIAVYQILQGYFTRVVRAHDALPGVKKYVVASVVWLPAFLPVASHELLIYLLPAGATLVTNGKLEQGHPAADHDGFTNPNLTGGTGSEVYYHGKGTTVLANLMFHEAMHNKLALGNVGLHSRGGMGSAVVTPSTELTPRNVADMAAALDVNRPQWTAGMGLLATAWMVPDSDPSKGLF
jgi:hypothetical protein